MVKLRLTRMGDKKTPFYRIIATDSRTSRDGKYIDLIGTYNPLLATDGVKIDVEKTKQWLTNGAQPTDTVRAILVAQGILEGTKAPAKTGKRPKAKD